MNGRPPSAAGPSVVDRAEGSLHAWYRQFLVTDAETPWPDEETGGLDHVYTEEALQRGWGVVDGTLVVHTTGRGDALTQVVVELWGGPPPPADGEWERAGSFLLRTAGRRLLVLESETSRPVAELVNPSPGVVEGRVLSRNLDAGHRSGGGDVHLVQLWPSTAG